MADTTNIIVITLQLHRDLLSRLDTMAQKRFNNRSEYMRRALLNQVIDDEEHEALKT